ncbi:MAG: hypothetical protein QXR41_07850, partial [Nitrososphaerota archaeon]
YMSEVAIKISKEDVLYVAKQLKAELTDEQIEEVLETTKDILLNDETFERIVNRDDRILNKRRIKHT